jgi:hypothetical protein
MKPYCEACERNREPLLAVLRRIFAERRRVLEIGSGTELRAGDAAGGVRDFEHIQALAARCGLAFLEDNTMPANNRLLVFEKKG